MKMDSKSEKNILNSEKNIIVALENLIMQYHEHKDSSSLKFIGQYIDNLNHLVIFNENQKIRNSKLAHEFDLQITEIKKIREIIKKVFESKSLSQDEYDTIIESIEKNKNKGDEIKESFS